MTKEFGKLRHVLVLLEILLGKEVAEGVGTIAIVINKK